VATLKADLNVCQGYANCVVAAGDYFDLSDEGKVQLLKVEIAEEDRVRVEHAVRSCPVSALSIEE